MKAIDMKPNKPYRATCTSKDKTIGKGQLIWLSEDGLLNVTDKNGGGFLLEEEWKSPDTCSFEVEEDKNYKIVIIGRNEILKKK